MVATAKGRQTRESILRRAAEVFNLRGYFGTAISDVMEATGLEKGGLYNHFASKDELALAAFDYAVERIRQAYRVALADKERALDRLSTIVTCFAAQEEKPVLKGGCPILNTAVESDDAHPELRRRARRAMEDWHRLIISSAERGIACKELRKDCDPPAVASLITATLEGALMLSRLYRDPAHLHRAVAHLLTYIESLKAEGERS